MPVHLRPLDAEGRAALVEEETANWAEQQVRDAGWAPSEAPERARAELRPLLEREVAEATVRGERLWSCVDDEGTTVGWLWVRPLEGGAAFLHQITVAERLRRRGHGRTMLAALEEVLAAEGVEELRLNVFAANEPARNLYAAAGYEQVGASGTRLHLHKRLGPPGAP